MRLTPDGIRELARHRLEQNVVVLRKYFHNWDEMPADAQLCCLSMAWAVGAGFPAIFTNFTKLVNAGNYAGAIQACGIKADNNPGVIPRNAANRLCLSNAAKATALGLPAGELFWPGVPPTSDDKEWKLKAEAEAALALHPPHFGWDTAGQSVSNWAKDDEEGEPKA